MTETRVKIAEFAVGKRDGTLATVGLGSCVAIALYDAEVCVGGLAHILLPSETMSRDRKNPGRFPATAVPALLQRMRGLGANQRRVTARLAGGASMFNALLPKTGIQIGERNVLATLQALEHAGVPVAAQEVGGSHGRSVFLRLSDGQLTVRSLYKGDVIL